MTNLKSAISAGLAAVGAFWLMGLSASAPASANIIGFANGVGYTSNTNGQGLSFSGNSLTLTNSIGGEANSAFFNTQQSVSQFTASFTYQVTNPVGCVCDGVAFILQTSAAGVHALGGGGGGYGYAGIAPSAAVELGADGLFSPGGPGTGFYTNGTVPQTSGPPLLTFSNVGSGHVIQANLSYSGTTLSETLTDLTTLQTFSHTYTGIDLASILGSSTAFVGFSGGTGGGASTQVLTNFSYTTTTAVPEPASLTLFGTALLGFGVISRRRRSV